MGCRGRVDVTRGGSSVLRHRSSTSYNSFHQDKERKAVKHPWVLGIQAVMATTTVTGSYL